MNAEAVETFARFMRVLVVAKFEPYEDAAAVVSDFREGLLPLGPWRDERAVVALRLAERCVEDHDYEAARVWALRTLQDGPRFDAFALLGDLAEHDGRINDAIHWYECAVQMKDVFARYSSFSLRSKLVWRLEQFRRRQKEIDARATLANLPMRPVRWLADSNHHTVFDEWGNMAGLYALIDAHLHALDAEGLPDYITVSTTPLTDELRAMVRDAYLDDEISLFVWTSPYRVTPSEPAWLVRPVFGGVSVWDDFRIVTMQLELAKRLHRRGADVWVAAGSFGRLILENCDESDLFAFYAPQVLPR